MNPFLNETHYVTNIYHSKCIKKAISMLNIFNLIMAISYIFYNLFRRISFISFLFKKRFYINKKREYSRFFGQRYVGHAFYCLAAAPSPYFPRVQNLFCIESDSGRCRALSLFFIIDVIQDVGLIHGNVVRLFHVSILISDDDDQLF